MFGSTYVQSNLDQQAADSEMRTRMLKNLVYSDVLLASFVVESNLAMYFVILVCVCVCVHILP